MSGRSAPVRPPAVLRAPLRLLRLRHRGRAGGSARGVRRRAARRARARVGALAPRLETIFLGGGTPTFTAPAALERLLAGLPDADEVTVEANPETVTPELARLLSRNRVNRVSLGAQSFNTALLAVLERRAQPEDVRRSVHVLRDAGFDNISLDLIYGIPGQTPADLDPTSPRRSRSSPSTCPATSWRPSRARASPTRTESSSSVRPSRWRPTSSRWSPRSRAPATAGTRRRTSAAPRRRAGPPGEAQPRVLARTRLPRPRDRRGLDNRGPAEAQRAEAGRLPRRARGGRGSPRELEPLDDGTRRRERVLLGLRLDEPLPLAGLEEAVDADALARLERLGLAVRTGANGDRTLALTERGRFLGGGVTADLLA